LAAISGDKKEQSFEIFTLVFLEGEKTREGKRESFNGFSFWRGVFLYESYVRTRLILAMYKVFL
jgi:hypothetical protein